jgi:predicted nucleotidyltransferase
VCPRLDIAVGEVVDGVVATYLHGSAALGGFAPGRGDIDALVVLWRSAHESRRAERCRRCS